MIAYTEWKRIARIPARMPSLGADRLTARSTGICFAFLTVFALLEGCSTTRTLSYVDRPLPGGFISYSDAKDQIEGKNARLTLRNGKVVNGKVLLLKRDSISIAPDIENHPDTSCALADVATVRTWDHGAGALEGLMFGLVGGVGLAVGVGGMSRGQGGELDFGKAYAAFLGGIACIIGGTAIGASDGHAETIEIPTDSTNTNK